MRVLIVNTSESTGGAAVAAHRLMDALNNHGVKATMLVGDRTGGKAQNSSLTVVNLKGRWRQQWNFLWERLVIFCHLHLRRQHLFEIDIANAGTDITRLRVFRKADVIHLHWVNQGLLSLDGIHKILRSGKPVVWTMHDMWPATAICHYTRGCENYRTACTRCPLLPPSSQSLASQVWRRKQRILEKQSVTYVACSQWLEKEARQSALLQEQTVTSIPNAIDTRVFRPADQTEARAHFGIPANKQVILFVSQRVTDERKGMGYFVEAIEKLVTRHPALRETTVVAIMGGHAEDVVDQLALPTFPLGYVSQSQAIVAAYSTADVFVLPSLEDNLPNTLMEAMACGVPCVGFKVGGIPEMIDHKKTGYLSEFRSADDLATGIHWVLEEADRTQLADQCLHKVARNYSQSSVSMKYLEVYNQALALSNYKL